MTEKVLKNTIISITFYPLPFTDYFTHWFFFVNPGWSWKILLELLQQVRLKQNASPIAQPTVSKC